MASKNRIDVHIKGDKNDTRIAGGSIGHRPPSSGDSENEVKAIIEGDENKQIITGSDIEQISQINSVLSDLVSLLIAGLKEKNDKEFVQEIINELKEQVAKPEPERNKSKIKGALNNLGSYVGLVGFAVSQAEKIKILYEQVIKFFG